MTDVERVEEILEGMKKAIEGRSYVYGSVTGVRYLQLLLCRNLIQIDELLLKASKEKGTISADGKSPYFFNF